MRVSGHGLVSEGQFHLASKFCRDPECVEKTEDGSWEYFSQVRNNRAGHALCSCGAESGHLPSAAARKRWHRNHKGEISA
jgi:hypothetical protein